MTTKRWLEGVVHFALAGFADHAVLSGSGAEVVDCDPVEPAHQLVFGVCPKRANDLSAEFGGRSELLLGRLLFDAADHPDHVANADAITLASKAIATAST